VLSQFKLVTEEDPSRVRSLGFAPPPPGGSIGYYDIIVDENFYRILQSETTQSKIYKGFSIKFGVKGTVTIIIKQGNK